MPNKLTFAGHETFHCRPLWLHKAYHFIKEDGKFSDPMAVVKLGVGKNMVSSINYWMKVFGLMNEEGKPTELADYIFGANGVDQYLESDTTLWLLHYHLVSEGLASIYSMIYNEFRKQRIEFNKTQLMKFIETKCKGVGNNFNDNTVERDINVFIKNYVPPKKADKNIEELYSGLFIELGIVEKLQRIDDQEWFRIENKDRESIPAELILYVLLENSEKEKTINFDEIANGYNSPGSVFALDSKSLLDKIEYLCHKYKVTFSDNAGIKTLQLKSSLNKWNILEGCYEK